MKNRLAFPCLLLLAMLTADSLSGQQVTVTGRVTHEDDGAPVANATVSIPELGLSTTTGVDGRFTLSVPAESVRGQIVELRVVAPGLQSKPARITLAPGELTQDFSLGFAFQQDVVVGSRAAGAASEKAVPVDVFTEEQIEEASGTMETNQIIQKLTPSFNFPRPTITDGTDSVRPATLRNLGPDQLLVLVNGKRRHVSALVNVNNSVGRGSSGVDLNAIPAAAIERIEVLRDGAAAQYGSDAIAGVINIVLKSGVEPLKLGLVGGMTTHSDGELIDFNGVWGAPVGNGSITVTGEYRDRNETNRAGTDLRDQIVAGDGGNNAVPQPNHHWGDSEATDIMGFVNANIPITADATTALYAFGGWSRRDGSHGGFYRLAINNRNWPQIYPLGFLPLIEPDVEDYSGTAGVRGVVSNLFWDVSVQYGQNTFDFNLRNTLNTSLGPNIPPNQTTFYAGSLEFNHFLANLDLTREFDVGFAGPLNVAGGLEYRNENFQQHAGEPNSYIDGGFSNQFGGRAEIGAQVFPGYRPSNEADEDRDTYAIYLDLEADVLRMLRLGIAGRFEDYSDFGSTSDGKITLRFQPLQPLVFRAAASTGFRAPSLSQSFFSSTSTTFLAVGTPPVLTPFEVATFRVDSPQARVLGAEDLKPEESVNLSAGIVVNPIPALEFTADFWRIDIDDRIVLSGNFTGPAIAALLNPLGANGGRFFTNAIDTETEGFDLTGRYNWNLGSAGRLDLTAAYSKSETKIVRVSDTPPQLAGFQEVLFDRVVRRLTVCGQPEDNLRLGADWQKDRLGFLVRTNRYGEYCSFTNPVQFDQTFSDEWVTDVELAYTLKPLTFAVGAQNVFDNFPDRNIGPDAMLTGPAGAQEAVFTYPRNSPLGMNGRFVYTRVSYTF